MKEHINQLKSFNWRLFIALCSLALIPAIYQTIKTFIISSNNPSNIFDIIGQLEWFNNYASCNIYVFDQIDYYKMLFAVNRK